jgi:hypothetical protein
MVSAILDLTDERNAGPLDPDDGDAASTRATLVESFLELPFAETTAALTVLRLLLFDDDDVVERIEQELLNRPHPMPAWPTMLDGATVDAEVWTMTHVLGDGENYLIGVRLPSREGFAALVYVDHNMGTIVKDAFVVAEPLENIVKGMRELADADQTVEPFDGARARAVITDAIASGASIYEQPRSETWPACRPLVEWIVSLLPDGGELPERLDWSLRELGELADEFFASAHGATLDTPDSRELVKTLLDVVAVHVGDDPLRWSPVNVEMLLVDWFPSHVVGDAELLARLPELLRAFVSFSHAKRGIPSALTAETLASVDQWEPAYLDLIEGDEPNSAVARALASGLLLEDPDTFMLTTLDDAVGGRDVLMSLDDSPLPDEPFAWDGIPDDVHSRVAEMLELCDGLADALLDVEHRTAMRRFLARAAAGDPALFRRKASPARGAAAVAWAVCRANESAGGYLGADLEVRELLGWFGVKGSVSQRAEPLLRAIGAPSERLWVGVDLGSADLLVAARRRAIIELRDRYLGA